MKIGLFCAAGFSTGMLVNNMKVAAQELGIDAEIEAYSQAKLADFAPEIDVALLGPQVAYTLDKSKAICEANHIPIAKFSLFSDKFHIWLLFVPIKKYY